MRVLPMLFLLFSTSAALAQETSENDLYLRDYIGLTKLLRTQGIDPVGVNWPFIESLCLGLKKERNQVPYNRCRYEKVMGGIDYRADHERCARASRAGYPDSLALLQTQSSITRPDGTRVTISETPPLTPADLYAKRDALFDACMDEKGWVDPYNWQRGKHQD